MTTIQEDNDRTFEVTFILVGYYSQCFCICMQMLAELLCNSVTPCGLISKEKISYIT